MQIIKRIVNDIETVKQTLKTWSKEKKLSEFNKVKLQNYRINMYKVVKNVISLRAFTLTVITSYLGI